MNANDQIRQMTLDGMGPSEIARALSAAGIRNTRGTVYSVQRVHQVVHQTLPDRETVRAFGRCRRGFVQSLAALQKAAQTDARSRSGSRRFPSGSQGRRGRAGRRRTRPCRRLTRTTSNALR